MTNLPPPFNTPPADEKDPLSWVAHTEVECALELEAFPIAPSGQQDSMRKYTEFLDALSAKLENPRRYEKYDPKALTSIVPKISYREIEVLTGHDGWVTCLQALPDGRIVSGGDDNSLRIWDGDPL